MTRTQAVFGPFTESAGLHSSQHETRSHTLQPVEDSAKVGFETILVEDACRAVDIGGSREAALQRFAELGIDRVSAQQLTA